MFQTRSEQLNFIEEKRMRALCHGQCYQRRIARAYDKKVKPRIFQEGDLVLKNSLLFKEDPQGKFKPNYEGPYVITKVLAAGALQLSNVDGDSSHELVNFDSVKLYYV